MLIYNIFFIIFFINILISSEQNSFSLKVHPNTEIPFIFKPHFRPTDSLQKSHPKDLAIYGPGISDLQAAMIQSYIISASKDYHQDIFNNAEYIQDAIENSDSFQGKWTIEILNQVGKIEDNWVVIGDVNQEKWFELREYGEFKWTYKIWTASC